MRRGEGGEEEEGREGRGERGRGMGGEIEACGSSKILNS